MANLHKTFLEFDKKLNITITKANRIRTSELNIKNGINKYFKLFPTLTYKFARQGSFALRTLIRTQKDTCDLDFGLRFFPFPNLSPLTLQKYVSEALKNIQNSTYPIHKKKCIRLIYKSDYHIDITVYGVKVFKGSPFLATKDGWEESDPSNFKKWFEEKGGKNISQLQRMVKYFKAWADNKANKMPKGVILTVLVAENFISEIRDDIALRETAKKIHSILEKDFSCKMPVEPFDDLIEEFTYAKQDYFLKKLNAFVSDAILATQRTTKETKALQIWSKHLGKYFK